MKHIVVGALVLALGGSALPLAAAGRGSEATGHGSISGTAANTDRTPLARHLVRVRDLDNGIVTSTTQTGAVGEFSFGNLTPGQYVVEVVTESGAVLGTSSAVTVASGATVSGVFITASAAAKAGLAGAVAGGTFFKSTAGVVLLSAASAGVVATTAVVRKDASPTR